MRLRFSLLLVGLLLVGPVAEAKKKDEPPGVIAASADEIVVLADPDGGWRTEFDAGTVGWLYPAPAGIIFAPDLTRGRTTVLDIRLRQVRDRFDGITMPHFGASPDRYILVVGEILVMSYPDRALISRLAVDIPNPWQVITATDDRVVLVLARRHTGDPEPVLTAVDLISKSVVYRRPLAGDVRRMALSENLGLLAFADAAAPTVLIADPATLNPVASLSVNGSPRDLCFLSDGQGLVAVTADSEGGGRVHFWILKGKKGELKVKKEIEVVLSTYAARVAAAPTEQRRVAVGLETPGIQVVNLDDLTVERTIELTEPARDLVWVDPQREGPMLPEWSDESPAELEIGRPKR
jgi:hypothetical protein